MLQIIDLHKGYGQQVLLRGISFHLTKGERLGVVGRNGHGKSTLFKMILGLEGYDSGQISKPPHYKIGHLSQKLVFTEPTVLEEACLGLPEQEGGWKETYKAESVLTGLGFRDEEFHISPEQLSGGYQIRLNLTKLLVSEPNLLLLDEPTNYLDLPSVRWLVRFLQDWTEELMLITHDRSFMDQVTTHTLAIHRGGAKKIEGNTAKLYEQIALEEEVYENTRVNQLKEREKTEEFINRFRSKATKASAVQSKIKALEKLPTMEELEAIQTLSFRFTSAPFTGKFVCKVTDLNFGFNEDEPLIQDLSFAIQKSDCIGVIGKNGKGKTTLLNVLAGDLKHQNGHISYSDNAKLAYFGQTNVDRLAPEKTIEDEVFEAHPSGNRTHVRALCGAMMFSGDTALKQIKVLSGGERSRVLLAKVLAQPANILFLDEPTNHLDMQSAEELEAAIRAFPGAIVFVTHDEGLLRAVANRLIIFDDGKVTLFEGGYDDFLRRIGWNDEAELNISGESGGQAQSNNKKELRKARAEDKKRLRELLKPIENKIKKIEKEIIEREALLEKEQAELIEITKEGYGDDAVKLTRSIADHKKQIEELFEALEEVTSEKEMIATDK